MRTVDVGLKILSVGAVLTPLIYTWCFLSVRVTPWWSDPGEWLKYANAVEAWLAKCLGVTSPDYEAMLSVMWNQGVFQYPPLPFLILIGLKHLLGPLQALKFMGLVLFALQPIPMYFLAKKITNSRLGGLIAAYATSFLPINIEMLGWGGYPNLLGLLLLSTNIFFTISTISDPRARNLCLMILTSIIIPFAHHLTSGIFLGVLFLWIVFLVTMRKASKAKYLAYNLTVGLTALVLYRALLANPSQFVLFNEAAYHSLRVNFLEAATWALKTPAIVVVILIIASFTILRRSELLQKEYQALLLAWFLFPVIATQSYLLGIAIDFNRVFFFAFQPLPILIASPFSLINRKHEMKESMLSNNPLKSRLSKKLLSTMFILFLSTITTIMIFLTGTHSVANVAEWYSSQDAYGDYEKLSALEWIKHETQLNSIFISDEYMGRWIEGYASRRTYLYMEPRFLFIKGQLERYYIASSILLADKEIRNGYLRVLDQAPYNMNYTPIICFWNKGEYRETLFIDEEEMVEILKNLTRNNLVIASKACREMNCIETCYVNRTPDQGNVLLMKKVIMVDDHKVYVVYEAAIKNITVHVFFSPKRAVNLVEVYGKQVVIHTDLGRVIIEADAKEIMSEARRIKLHTDDDSLRLQIFLEKPVRNELNQTIVLESSRIIEENSISYIVVPRVSLKGFETMPEYQHLLNKLKVAYVNDKVIILDAGKANAKS